MDYPKITVLIRTYNSEASIDKAINSALQQSINELLYEILIVDDGSQDNTKKILSTYKNKKKIRVDFQDHMGPIKILNYGINESFGETIVLLDSDDEFIPETLETLWNAYSEHNGDFVYSDYYEKSIDKEQKEIFHINGNIFHTIAAGILFRRSDLIKIGLYDENLIFPEYDLLLKLENNNLNGYYITKPLYIYNRRQGSMTSDKNIVMKGKEQLSQKWNKFINIRDY